MSETRVRNLTRSGAVVGLVFALAACTGPALRDGKAATSQAVTTAPVGSPSSVATGVPTMSSAGSASGLPTDYPWGPPDKDWEAKIGNVFAGADRSGKVTIQRRFAGIIRSAKYEGERLSLDVDKVELVESAKPGQPRYTNASKRTEAVEFLRPLVFFAPGTFVNADPRGLVDYLNSDKELEPYFMFYESGGQVIIAEGYAG